ncbi:Heavy metal RND efflux outer membrane protein, CzcC family [Oxalobacteraceae bacterium IMCC9480]|nr:Heavy metal RND efflux outer membrane protein, CzcC family [Oxalobacteraceae bacterium IMCC9480]
MYRFLLPISLAVSCVGNVYAQQTPQPSQIQSSVRTAPQVPAAEPDGILSLQAALALAMSSNVELSAARYEVEAIGASVLQAGARPNPEVAIGMEDTRKETRETTIQLSQAIELGGKRQARVQAAERGRDTANADLKLKQAEIRATTITYYFDVLSAQERVLLSQDALDLARRGSLVASKRVSAGKASPVEETKAKVAESSVRVELLQAKNELATARKRLSSTWGNLSPRFASVDGNINDLPALPEIRTLADRFANAPGLSRARSEVERRQAMVVVERTRRIPDVTLTLGIRRSEELGRNQTIFGVSMPIPIFDTNQGNILESL